MIAFAQATLSDSKREVQTSRVQGEGGLNSPSLNGQLTVRTHKQMRGNTENEVKAKEESTKTTNDGYLEAFHVHSAQQQNCKSHLFGLHVDPSGKII